MNSQNFTQILLVQTQQAGQITSPTDITIPALIGGITNILPAIIITIFLAMVIYGGFLRITSGGNEDKMQQSNRVLTSAIIGFVIIVLSALIVNLVGLVLDVGPLINA